MFHSSRAAKNPSYTIGQRVEGFLNDEWHAGRVAEHNRDGTYVVKFDDDFEMNDMSEQELRFMEDEVLVAEALERRRLMSLHGEFRQAANHGDLPTVIKLLSEPGLDINSKDGSGWSALSWASKMNRVDVVQFLLENGADINCPDNNSDSPLIWSCRKNNVKVVEILVNMNAELNCTNKNGWTALMECSARANNDCLCLLLHKGAKTSIKNNDGKTAEEISKTSATRGLIKAADGEFY